MTTAGRTVALLTAIAAICAAPLACSSASSQGATSPSDAAADRGARSLHDASLGGTDAGWALIWSDEFNEANGSAPDPTKWTTTSLGTATSGQGWGLEYDTPSANSIEDGNLVITATKAADGGIFSGAFDSKGRFQQAYGRFEARIQVVGGAGAWSAFWLMGDTNGQGWPTCGEIDIVETVSTTPDVTYGTWSPDLVEFYFDGTLYKTDTPADLTQGEVWAFDSSHAASSVGGRFMASARCESPGPRADREPGCAR